MNTKEPFVITISREVGSGGHTVGHILAYKLGVRFCDKQLIEALERQFGLSSTSIEQMKAQKKNWLNDFLSKVYPMPSAQAFDLDSAYAQERPPVVTTNDIYKAEVEILKEFARMDSCVIAGRLGFHVFKDHPNQLKVFIMASLPCRVERVMQKQNLSEEKALDLIKNIDKARENYIQRYAGVSRYDLRNYDLTLTADGRTEEELADYILSYIG